MRQACKNIVLKFYPLFIFTAFALTGYGQPGNIKFENIGTSAGLSQISVNCVLQDKYGFMWFGTQDGLNKYDGYKFTVYKNDPLDRSSISHNFISDIVEDENGNLWISTWGGGINKFDRLKEKFTSYKHRKDSNSISGNLVNAMIRDHSGKLWIGTQENGLNRFDPKTGRFTHYMNDPENSHSLPDNDVLKLMEDSQNGIWIATQGGGLSMLNPAGKWFTNYKHEEGNKSTIASNIVHVIFEDSRQQIWVGTSGKGINLLNKERTGFRHFANIPGDKHSMLNDIVFSITEDKEKNIWLGTQNQGISLFNPATGKFQNYKQELTDKNSLNNNAIYSIYQDRKGNIWIGAYAGGINFINCDGGKFRHYKQTPSSNSLSNDKILCIYEDSQSELWIGTDGGGLNRFNPATGAFTHYRHKKNNKSSIASDYVTNVMEDHEGNLWVGTWGDGITVFNRKKNTWRHFTNKPSDSTSLISDNIWMIYQDREKNIWVGAYGDGLDLFDPKTGTFTHFRHDQHDPSSLSSNNVLTIFEDSKGLFWIGTDGGGFNLFDKKTKTFRNWQHEENKNSLSNNTVNCFLEDKLGNFWISTDAGLNYWDRQKNSFNIYFSIDGLPHNTTVGMLEDGKGNIWISTFKGLSKFNPDKKSFQNYNVTDGLQSNEFRYSYCKSRSGKLYYGGNNGFNEFYPDSVQPVSFDPPLLITDFQLFNRSVAIEQGGDPSPLKMNINNTNEINLSHEQSVFSFEFASLNYTDPEKKQYAYMLEGFDEKWNEVGKRQSATYTNLDPGNYTFKVKGLDNEGNWSTKITSVSVNILPPIWKTWWFRTAFIIFLTGLVFLIFGLRVRNIRSQKRKLEKLVQERTERLEFFTEEERKARWEAEEANRSKSVFLATMSHEIRTPMNGVIGMASLLSETSLTEQQKDFTDTIRSCGETLLTVINDILDYSKIESGKLELEEQDFDLRHCVEEILDVFAGKAAETGIDLVYSIDFNVPSAIAGDSMRLKQVIMNLVSNSVKFTSKGEIFIGISLFRIEQNGELELSIQVRDTGIGIPVDKLDRLFKPFTQVDSSTTRKYGGTGLGLAISEKLVRLMGGSIKVKSKDGKGSVFMFTIKAKTASQNLRAGIQSDLSSLSGKRVLVVDDNQTNRNILKAQLLQWKMVPELAASGKEALQILEQNSAFDLILTDMQMPAMNGIQLAAKHQKSWSYYSYHSVEFGN